MKTIHHNWRGRSLKNYKRQHHATARNAGVLDDFLGAQTLTEARKILFGTKPKQKPLRKTGRKKSADL